MHTTQVFFNFPVKDLKKSIEFYTKVGYTFNQQFTDETATCMIISDTIYSMLLTHEKFQSFLPPGVGINDSMKTKEVLVSLNHASREEVDRVLERAIAAGGKEVGAPTDHGFMYERG